MSDPERVFTDMHVTKTEMEKEEEENNKKRSSVMHLTQVLENNLRRNLHNRENPEASPLTALFHQKESMPSSALAPRLPPRNTLSLPVSPPALPPKIPCVPKPLTSSPCSGISTDDIVPKNDPLLSAEDHYMVPSNIPVEMKDGYLNPKKTPWAPNDCYVNVMAPMKPPVAPNNHYVDNVLKEDVPVAPNSHYTNVMSQKNVSVESKAECNATLVSGNDLESTGNFYWEPTDFHSPPKSPVPQGTSNCSSLPRTLKEQKVQSISLNSLSSTSISSITSALPPFSPHPSPPRKYSDIEPPVPKNLAGLSKTQVNICQQIHEYHIIKTSILALEQALDGYSRLRNNVMSVELVRSSLNMHSIVDIKKILAHLNSYVRTQWLPHDMTFYNDRMNNWFVHVLLQQRHRKFWENRNSDEHLYIRVGSGVHKLVWKEVVKIMGPALTYNEDQKQEEDHYKILENQPMTCDFNKSPENLMIHALAPHLLFSPTIKYFINIRGYPNLDITLTIVPDKSVVRTFLTVHAKAAFHAALIRESQDTKDPLQFIQNLFMRGYVESSRIRLEDALSEVTECMASFVDMSVPDSGRCFCTEGGFHTGDVVLNTINPKKSLVSVIIREIPMAPYQRIGRVTSGLQELINEVEQRKLTEKKSKNKSGNNNDEYRYWITTGIDL